MNESEKRLRELILERTYSDSAKTQYEADLEALKAAARDAALGEAALAAQVVGDELQAHDRATAAEGADCAADRIRALQTQPVAVVSVEKVRDVLLKHRPVACQDGPERWYLVRGIAESLGVNLDATKEPSFHCDARPRCERQCTVCAFAPRSKT